MSTNAQAYLEALFPPGLDRLTDEMLSQPEQHLSDEDVSAQLDKSAKHSRAARKAQETIRQKRAEQQASQEKSV